MGILFERLRLRYRRTYRDLFVCAQGNRFHYVVELDSHKLTLSCLM